eukprot:752760-Alexandrium_andersonii.AAC.1
MSASLVGSEMCIRDRGGDHGRLHSRLRRHQGGRQGPCRHALLQAKPVSYTHLTLPTICSV